MRVPKRNRGGQYIWSLADQVISSLTNVIGMFSAARMLEADEFGALSLAAAASVIFIGIARSLVSEPMLVSPEHRSDRFVAMSGAGLAIGSLFAAMLLPIALVVGGMIGTALLALALCSVGLLLQDTIRYAYLVAGTPKRAAFVDLYWLLTTVVLVAASNRWWSGSLFVALIVWLGGASIAAIIDLGLSRARPHLRAGARLMADHRKLGASYLAEFLTLRALGQVALFGLTLVLAVEAVGSIRAAELLFGPLVVLHSGIYPVVLPSVVRKISLGKGPLRVSAAVSAFSATTALGLTGLLILVPNSWLRHLLGATTSGASDVLLLVGLGFASRGLVAGPTVGLRALGQQSLLARSRVSAGVLALVPGLIAARTSGIRGFVLVGTVASLFLAIAAWNQLISAARAPAVVSTL